VGNLGFTEIMVILLVVLLLFGAKRLPEVGSSIGKGIREFKRSLSDTQDAIMGSDESRNLQSLDLGDLIAKHGDSEWVDCVHDPRGNFRMGPVRTVVVVPQNCQRSHAPLGKVAIEHRKLFENPVVVTDEVAGKDDDVRLQIHDLAKRCQHVVVAHASSDVHVADLNQGAAHEGGRQVPDRELTADKLQPVRLDAPRVQANACGGANRDAPGAKKPTTADHSIRFTTRRSIGDSASLF